MRFSPHFQLFYFNDRLEICEFFEWKIKRINNADLFSQLPLVILVIRYKRADVSLCFLSPYFNVIRSIDLQVEHTALLLLSRVTWQSVIAASAVENCAFFSYRDIIDYRSALVSLVWRSVGMMVVEGRTEVHKQDPHINPWFVQMLQDEVQSHVDCIIHGPVCSVSKQQGVQSGSSDVLQISQKPVFQMTSWRQALEPQVCSR